MEDSEKEKESLIKIMSQLNEEREKLLSEEKYVLLIELQEIYDNLKKRYDKLDGRYVEVLKQDLGKTIQELNIDTFIDSYKEYYSGPNEYDEDNYHSFIEVNCTLYKNQKEVKKGILFRHTYHYWCDVDEYHDQSEIKTEVIIVNGKVFEDFDNYKSDNDEKTIYCCHNYLSSDELEPEVFFNEYVKRLTN